MSEETAKALIEALNRMATAIERVSGPTGTLVGNAIKVFHHNSPSYQVQQDQTTGWQGSYRGNVL